MSFFGRKRQFEGYHGLREDASAETVNSRGLFSIVRSSLQALALAADLITEFGAL